MSNTLYKDVDELFHHPALAETIDFDDDDYEDDYDDDDDDDDGFDEEEDEDEDDYL